MIVSRSTPLHNCGMVRLSAVAVSSPTLSASEPASRSDSSPATVAAWSGQSGSNVPAVAHIAPSRRGRVLVGRATTSVISIASLLAVSGSVSRHPSHQHDQHGGDP